MLYYFTDLKNITDEQLDRFMSLLPPERLKRALKYKFPEGRLACVIAYLLFLYGYRTEYNLTGTPDFDISGDGKPYLKCHPEIHFNISHCSKAVMCIFDSSPVGIDVEIVRRVPASMLAKICSPDELNTIGSSATPEADFCRIWTYKEAVSKLSGDGVFKSLRKSPATPLFSHQDALLPDVYYTVASDGKIDLTSRELTLSDFEVFFGG